MTEGVEPPPHFPGVSGPPTEILEKVRDREQAQLREITLAAVVASSRPPAPWRPPAPRPSE